MSYQGLISHTLAPVKPGTVISLTDRELKQDPKDLASSKMKVIYENKYTHPAFSTQTGPRTTIREQVLAMSLFPNIINSKYTKEETGAYRSGGAVGP
jgi:hypothetical protein